MTDAGFFRGTNSEQDTRFSDKQKKLLKTMKFADSLAEKVDFKKVKLDTLKPWIATRITEMLGLEDEVVVEYVFQQLEESGVDPRMMQINLTGFLNGKNAREFMKELWDMLVSAQINPSGIPTMLLEAKKVELRERELEHGRVSAAIKKTKESIEQITKKDVDVSVGKTEKSDENGRDNQRRNPVNRQQRRSPMRRSPMRRSPMRRSPMRRDEPRSPMRSFRRSRSPRRDLRRSGSKDNLPPARRRSVVRNTRSSPLTKQSGGRNASRSPPPLSRQRSLIRDSKNAPRRKSSSSSRSRSPSYPRNNRRPMPNQRSTSPRQSNRAPQRRSITTEKESPLAKRRSLSSSSSRSRSPNGRNNNRAVKRKSPEDGPANVAKTGTTVVQPRRNQSPVQVRKRSGSPVPPKRQPKQRSSSSSSPQGPKKQRRRTPSPVNKRRRSSPSPPSTLRRRITRTPPLRLRKELSPRPRSPYRRKRSRSSSSSDQGRPTAVRGGRKIDRNAEEQDNVRLRSAKMPSPPKNNDARNNKTSTARDQPQRTDNTRKAAESGKRGSPDNFSAMRSSDALVSANKIKTEESPLKEKEETKGSVPGREEDAKKNRDKKKKKDKKHKKHKKSKKNKSSKRKDSPTADGGDMEEKLRAKALASLRKD